MAHIMRTVALDHRCMIIINKMERTHAVERSFNINLYGRPKGTSFKKPNDTKFLQRQCCQIKELLLEVANPWSNVIKILHTKTST